MRDDRGFGQKVVPVNVGDELEVTIESEGKKGDGVAKKDGFVLFVPGARQGQHLRIKVNRVLNSVGFAETIEELASAPAPVDNSNPTDPLPDAPAEAEPAPEDSEDFGEEPAEQPAAEESSETAEEPQEESAPAVEEPAAQEESTAEPGEEQADEAPAESESSEEEEKKEE